MTLYDEIKTLLSHGWHVQQVIYTNNVKVYNISQRISQDTIKTRAVVGVDCVRKLRKEVSFEYIKATNETCPLNFTPQRIKRGFASIIT